jgi:hypothetical protein
MASWQERRWGKMTGPCSWRLAPQFSLTTPLALLCVLCWVQVKPLQGSLANVNGRGCNESAAGAQQRLPSSVLPMAGERLLSQLPPWRLAQCRRRHSCCWLTSDLSFPL